MASTPTLSIEDQESDMTEADFVSDIDIIAGWKNSIQSKVLSEQRNQIVNEHMFNALGKFLSESSSISYETFKMVGANVPPFAKRHFTARTFLLFPPNSAGEIESESFLRYIERTSEIEAATLDLVECALNNPNTPDHTGYGPSYAIPSSSGSNSDADQNKSITNNSGSAPLKLRAMTPSVQYISEQQLEAYIFSLIQEIDVNGTLHESFYPYYVYTATQKFLFFLDRRRSNMMALRELAHSAVMEELLLLRRIAKIASEISLQEYELRTKLNWFDCGNALKIYSQFLDLDRDQNGMLNLAEAAQFVGFGREEVHFTPIALQRVFEEYITFTPFELDYKAFVNLVIALDNFPSLQAMRYFWKVLDYDRSGRLTADKIQYFYRGVFEALTANNYDAPSVNHVINEIFDMLGYNGTDSRERGQGSDERSEQLRGCSSSTTTTAGVEAEREESGATFAQLAASRQGHTVISMLLDVNGFWRYDNRESLVADPGGGGGGGREEGSEGAGEEL